MRIVVVDKPEKVEDCCFSFYDQELNDMGCSIQNGILCSLPFNLPCPLLVDVKEAKQYD